MGSSSSHIYPNDFFTFTIKGWPHFWEDTAPHLRMLSQVFGWCNYTQISPRSLGMAQKEGHEKIFTDRVGGKPAGLQVFSSRGDVFFYTLNGWAVSPHLPNHELIQDNQTTKMPCRRSWCPYVQDWLINHRLLDDFRTDFGKVGHS